MIKIKAVIVTLLILVSVLCPCFADELRLDRDTQNQKLIMETGFKLLNSSNVDKRMTFFYNPENKRKVKINNFRKSITVYKGMMPLFEDDDELAAALSTGIGALTDVQAGFFRRFSISFSPRKYEIKADKKAVDLMVNAGYDPVALIKFLNKTSSQPNWFEYNIFVHSGSERMAYIYQYIYEKYPIYLAQNRYINTRAYQNFLLNSKKTRHATMLIQKERLKKLEEEPKN